jgi:hypothetical protein
MLLSEDVFRISSFPRLLYSPFHEPPLTTVFFVKKHYILVPQGRKDALLVRSPVFRVAIQSMAHLSRWQICGVFHSFCLRHFHPELGRHGLRIKMVGCQHSVYSTNDVLDKLVFGRKEIEGLFVVRSPVEGWRNYDCVFERSLNWTSPLSILRRRVHEVVIVMRS